MAGTDLWSVDVVATGRGVRSTVVGGRRTGQRARVTVPANAARAFAQYRPPSLRWSQLTTFSGSILSTPRAGALCRALGSTADALSCAPARASNAARTLASSS